MTQGTIKWREVYEALSGKISAGEFKPGDSFLSMQAVCDRYEVSNITTRRVFAELRAKRLIRTNGRKGSVVTAEAVKDPGGKAAEPQTVFLCFRTHGGRFDAAAQPGHAPQLYHETLRGFQRSPLDRLFRIKPISIDFCLEHLDRFQGAPMIMNQEVLFSGPGDRPEIDLERADLVRKNFNSVVFQVYSPIPEMTEVRIDKAAGMRALVTALHNAGHRKIGYLSHDVTHLCYRSRFQGYLRGLEMNGLPFVPSWIGVSRDDDVRDHQAFVAHLLAESADRPTALVCANDSRALAVLSWCREHGVRVPDDLAVTGFDDLPECELSNPPLTTVDQRLAEMGYVALDLLRRRLVGPRSEPAKIVISPQIVLRGSHKMHSSDPPVPEKT